MRGKIVVERNYSNGGWCSKFHGESGNLYYADLMPSVSPGRGFRVIPSECEIFRCTTEGDDDSGIEWGEVLYIDQSIESTPESLKRCIEEFLGYPVDMEVVE